MTNKKELFIKKMADDGLDKSAIDIFGYYYDQLVSGADGFLFEEKDFTRIKDVKKKEELGEYKTLGEESLKHLAVIKLNGGLGTTMGLEGPKGLLPVRGNKTFIDIVVDQVISLRKNSGAEVPLIFMNSFATQEKTLSHLATRSDFSQSLDLDFIQNKFPKINEETLEPGSYKENPEKEWNPPGHGDLYIALNSSGLLDKLIDKGVKYLFISNIDNLGATVDYDILGYMAKNNIPYIAELTARTEMDRKGGHLGVKPDGELMLRDTAQVPPEEMDKFMDIERFKYFHINNLWMDIREVKKNLEANGNFFKLPLIKNLKTVNPVDKDSQKVIQVEATVGSGIQFFKGAKAIEVKRDRFLPVKDTSDLFLVSSDYYTTDDSGRLVLNPERKGKKVFVSLDKNYFGKMSDYNKRFSEGLPSIDKCSSLRVEGDFTFGCNVDFSGDVVLSNKSSSQHTIPDDSKITGKLNV